MTTGITALAIWTIIIIIVSSLHEGNAASVPFRGVAERKKSLENNEVISEEQSSHPGAFKSHQLALASTPGPDHYDYDVTWPDFQCNAQFGSFQCTSGQCILLAFRCDNNVDCDDRSDEEGCESGHQKQNPPTSGNEIFDISEEIQLPNWINGDKDQSFPASTSLQEQQHTADVNDDDDEPPSRPTSDWDEICSDTELFFRCSTGRCIFAAFRCDGDSDCDDASDERDCDRPTETSTAKAVDTAMSSHLSAYRLSEVREETAGRLEVYHDGRWGTVCNDDFDDTDAKVACVSLGYGCGSVDTSIYHKNFDQSQPIWLDEVRCVGTESSLQECQHAGWGNHNCRHDEDVYIRCSKCTEVTTDTVAPTTVSPTKETEPAELEPEDSDTTEDESGSGSGSGSGYGDS